MRKRSRRFAVKRSKAELIFDKWKAELADKDRSKAAVAGNFDELFSTWYRSKVSFDDAYALLNQAIKAHEPNDAISRNVYRRLKRVMPINKTEAEFATEWKSNIASTAKQVFYSLYDIEGTASADETAKYGNMSVQEYRKQRKYADSHPLLDWTKIKIDLLPDDDLDIDLEDL